MFMPQINLDFDKKKKYNNIFFKSLSGDVRVSDNLYSVQY